MRMFMQFHTYFPRFFYHHIKKTEETVFHMEYFIIFV